MLRPFSLIFLLLFIITPGRTTGERLIALTFDDGPRPYILLGKNPRAGASSAGLLDLLDRHGIKATFFVVGWRLEKTPSAVCRKVGTSTNCQRAAEEVHRHGHEIENHTYEHGSFKLMKERYGDEWILNDIERASRLIQHITGVPPRYVRPPNWEVWQELRKRIESKGYRVMVKPIGDIREPLITQDVDSEDYFCVGANLSKCPKPSLEDSVLRKIREREQRGIYGHILVFHELPVSVATLSALIPKLKAKGYTFARLDEYIEAIKRGAR